jgi:hypothetical protein
VVRFRPSNNRQPPNYLGRRLQWRLLVLVLGLGVTVLLLNSVRRPKTARFLDRVFAPAVEEPRISDEQIRELVRSLPTNSNPQDTFRMPAPGGAKQATSSEYFQAVQPQLLESIRDNTYFRSVETEAWFHLLDILQQSVPEELAEASLGEVGYVQMVQQPHVYRGRIVTVSGTVRRSEVVEVAENNIGLQQYYLLTMRPAGRQIWPIRIYCLELPDGFPLGEDVSASVIAHGFFFKNWSYQWEGGPGLAPILLARTVQWLDRGSDL